ncbi:hypothetical protein [Colwellia sp. MEBiC06753]
MEYSESIINGGVTYKHQCLKCGCEKHNVRGNIRYAYLLLESLPIYPVGKSIKLECVNCLHIVEQAQLEKSLYRQLQSSVFTIYHFLVKFLGLFLIAFALFSWWQSAEQSQRNIERIVSYPQVNDFMLLDQRVLATDTRPHENYRIAKIVDVTGDTVSLVFGNILYRHESAFENAIAAGQTRVFSYFGGREYHFTETDLVALYERGGIVKAARPTANMLFGNFVINDTGYRIGSGYIAGEREYVSGLAFEQASYLEDHQIKAFNKFLAAAEMGFALGQIKLAELYLAGEVIETNLHSALIWLEKAALQSNESAVKKYAIVCKQTKGCSVTSFYQRLIDHGVNLTVNEHTDQFRIVEDVTRE